MDLFRRADFVPPPPPPSDYAAAGSEEITDAAPVEMLVDEDEDEDVDIEMI